MSETNLFNQMYQPDVLTCLADLSNDEVFTPPTVANAMLDLLPKEIWHDPSIKILDPACKTGVFLREAAKHFIEGEKDVYPDLQQRIDHIFHEQLYGIAITELTSLISRRSVYCSKYPNSTFSVTAFDTPVGNILYHNTHHTWKNGTCVFCGASESQYDRGISKESHAYEFIHTLHPEEIWKMKFDVIIGNPPYQLSDQGFGSSAMPIYQKFVEQAKKLNPKYLVMITPSRWFSGGRGLDEFRNTMLHDHRIRKLVDYENYKDVFPSLGGLAGGASYFLWDRDHEGACEITNKSSEHGDIEETRNLDEYKVFIRSNQAIHIVRKVLSKHHGKYMSETVSPSKPFGLRTFYKPVAKGIPCQFIQKIGLKYADPKDVTDSLGILDKWKFVAPRSPIAGQTDFSKPVGFYYDGNTKILPPGTCCTESFVVLHTGDTKEEVESFKSYMFTKVARFLLLQCVVSQDVTREKFQFVPDLGTYHGCYSDEMLCEKWGITADEWKYIDSRISDIAGDD